MIFIYLFNSFGARDNFFPSPRYLRKSYWVYYVRLGLNYFSPEYVLLKSWCVHAHGFLCYQILFSDENHFFQYMFFVYIDLKYFFQNMTNELLPKILPCILEGLKDDDDDVRAVAATALVPVCNELVKLLPNEVCFVFEYFDYCCLYFFSFSYRWHLKKTC